MITKVPRLNWLNFSQRSYIIAQHLSAYSVAPFGFKSNLLINTIYRYLERATRCPESVTLQGLFCFLFNVGICYWWYSLKSSLTWRWVLLLRLRRLWCALRPFCFLSPCCSLLFQPRLLDTLDPSSRHSTWLPRDISHRQSRWIHS